MVHLALCSFFGFPRFSWLLACYFFAFLVYLRLALSISEFHTDEIHIDIEANPLPPLLQESENAEKLLRKPTKFEMMRRFKSRKTKKRKSHIAHPSHLTEVSCANVNVIKNTYHRKERARERGQGCLPGCFGSERAVHLVTIERENGGNTSLKFAPHETRYLACQTPMFCHLVYGHIESSNWPTSSAPASSVSASSVPASSVPASSVPASRVPASSISASTVPASSVLHPASSFRSYEGQTLESSAPPFYLTVV